MDRNRECDEGSVIKYEQEFLEKDIWKLAVLFLQLFSKFEMIQNKKVK